MLTLGLGWLSSVFWFCLTPGWHAASHYLIELDFYLLNGYWSLSMEVVRIVRTQGQLPIHIGELRQGAYEQPSETKYDLEDPLK